MTALLNTNLLPKFCIWSNLMHQLHS